MTPQTIHDLVLIAAGWGLSNLTMFVGWLWQRGRDKREDAGAVHAFGLRMGAALNHLETVLKTCVRFRDNRTDDESTRLSDLLVAANEAVVAVLTEHGKHVPRGTLADVVGVVSVTTHSTSRESAAKGVAILERLYERNPGLKLRDFATGPRQIADRNGRPLEYFVPPEVSP